MTSSSETGEKVVVRFFLPKSDTDILKRIAGKSGVTVQEWVQKLVILELGKRHREDQSRRLNGDGAGSHA